MEKCQVELQNATLENVWRYFYDQVKLLSWTNYSYVLPVTYHDGTSKNVTYHHAIQSVQPPRDNILVVEDLRSIEPDPGRVTEAHLFDAIKFTGYQLQNTVVLLEVEFMPYFGKVTKLLLDDLARKFGNGITTTPEWKAILEKINFQDRTGWDMMLITLWNEGHDRDYISKRVHKVPQRVTNRISELRRMFGLEYGKKILPENKERKEQMIKTRYMA